MESTYSNSTVHVECPRCGEGQTIVVTQLVTLKTPDEFRSTSSMSHNFLRNGGCEIDLATGEWVKVNRHGEGVRS